MERIAGGNIFCDGQVGVRPSTKDVESESELCDFVGYS